MTPAGRLVPIWLVVLASTAGMLGCGLPADDRVTPYNPGDLPNALAATTSTTSVPPSTVPPDTSDQVPAPTTTVVQTMPVEVFYAVGASDELRRITLALPAPVTITQLIGQLEQPPADGAQFNIRTSVRPGLITGVTFARNQATVDLSGELLARTSSREERRAIAQIALTLSFFVTGEGGVGGVTFQVDGEPIGVFLPAAGATSEPGEPVVYADFAPLVADGGRPTTSTSTPGPPPSSDPTAPGPTGSTGP